MLEIVAIVYVSAKNAPIVNICFAFSPLSWWLFYPCVSKLYVIIRAYEKRKKIISLKYQLISIAHGA